MSVNVAAILSQMPQGFDSHMVNLFNAACRTIVRVPVMEGYGQNAAFIANTGGQVATTYPDGYDIADSELNNDVQIPLTLPWAHYRSSFRVTQDAIDIAASSRGGAMELLNQFEQRLHESCRAIGKQLNKDIHNGTGSSNAAGVALLGFSNSVLASGSYGGQSLSSYPLLAGNITTSGGALSVALLTAMETKMFNSCNKYASMISMPPALHEKWTTLNMGTTNIVQGISKGEYNLSVRDDAVFFKGIPVVRDADQESGTVKFWSLDSSDLHIKVMPSVPVGDSVIFRNVMATDGQQSVGIPLIVESLSKGGPSTKITVRTPLLQACFRRGNSMGLITGVT